MSESSRVSQSKRRRLKGTVVSSAMNKTVVVAVERLRMHPRYHRRYRVTKRYQAHDETNRYAVGDAVVIEETPPISRHKRWKVLYV